MREVYLNGKFVPGDRAVVSVFDHGLLYGDGVFEGIRAYRGLIFKLDEHISRLYESARSIMLNIPIPPDEMRSATVEACRRNGLTDAYIRTVVTRGVGDLGLDPRKCPHPSVIIIADTIALYPREVYDTGMRVVTVPTRRTSSDALSPRVKSLNYLNNVMAKIEANHLGYAEVLMQNADGYIVEGTGDNVFAVLDGIVVTPPDSAGILRGITRQVAFELAAAGGYRTAERLLTRHDLFVADEVFLTGTAAEIVPVIEVDGRTIGAGTPGPITRYLIRGYRDMVETQGTPIGLPTQAVV